MHAGATQERAVAHTSALGSLMVTTMAEDKAVAAVAGAAAPVVTVLRAPEAEEDISMLKWQRQHILQGQDAPGWFVPKIYILLAALVVLLLVFLLLFLGVDRWLLTAGGDRWQCAAGTAGTRPPQSLLPPRCERRHCSDELRGSVTREVVRAALTRLIGDDTLVDMLALHIDDEQWTKSE